jgi:hypothetical protein
MLRLLGWLTAAVMIGFLVWQTMTSVPLWPQWLSALLLFFAGGLAGIRLATDAASAYIADLQRLNKVLADQNQELEEANAILLAQISAEAEVSSENS